MGYGICGSDIPTTSGSSISAKLKMAHEMLHILCDFRQND